MPPPIRPGSRNPTPSVNSDYRNISHKLARGKENSRDQTNEFFARRHRIDTAAKSKPAKCRIGDQGCWRMSWLFSSWSWSALSRWGRVLISTRRVGGKEDWKCSLRAFPLMIHLRHWLVAITEHRCSINTPGRQPAVGSVMARAGAVIHVFDPGLCRIDRAFSRLIALSDQVLSRVATTSLARCLYRRQIPPAYQSPARILRK